ncbi:PDZ domain-containing RING finger protein 4-like [Brevipalpus obovatus]|uniref:PDZ domain-containing RING finger protein 4-like n=1 Tax=Brevipalpus obovatus TaxID=246614 RepID=UPI003D9EA100
MGYAVNRFATSLDGWDRVICLICRQVIENGLEARCKHAFCSDCITKFLRDRGGSGRCPEDGCFMESSELVPISKTLKYLMGKQLMIHCDHHSQGCEEVVILEQLDKHVSRCSHRPSMRSRLFGSNSSSCVDNLQDSRFSATENLMVTAGLALTLISMILLKSRKNARKGLNHSKET